MAVATIEKKNHAHIDRGKSYDFVKGFVNNRTILSSVENISTIERQCRLHRISASKLCAAAGVSPATWQHARKHPASIRRGTLARLSAALDRLIDHDPFQRKPDVIACLHALIVDMLAIEINVSPAAVRAQSMSPQRPTNVVWLQAARLRRLAIYLLVVECDVRRALVADELGMSRQNISQAIHWVREADPIYTAAAANCALRLKTLGQR